MQSALNRATTGVLSVIQRFLVLPNQITFSGAGSTQQLCDHIHRLGHKKVLLITDKILVDLGLANRVVEGMAGHGGEVVIYDGVLPDPTVAMVNDGLALVKQHGCDAIVAMGGGSSIDTAKGVASAATNGGIEKLIGILKVKQDALPLFAIPTTSGTGSEVSIAAVISDPETHQKGVMADPKIVPQAVALDAELLTGMPPSVTASTGMDALSHAIETYIGRWSNNQVKSLSGTAIKLIFDYLPKACENGSDMQARESLALASYYAGLSLNDGGVGNVHAFAHQIGGQYKIPHGVAISAVMPQVLQLSLKQAGAKLAELADLIGVASAGDSEQVKAEEFIAALRNLQQEIGMPMTFSQIQTQDIRGLVKEALKEAVLYPVPYFMSYREGEQLIRQLQET
ncbi:iron-containing alcohol dehydrogenase [Maricurvus nonylphenolicus]|uniref:iron-containing alcohol dehydrogenase n=1 Tax=Maricurvus nonylphenolicus TaxID=1008307 RepID=UPI0036F2A0CE